MTEYTRGAAAGDTDGRASSFLVRRMPDGSTIIDEVHIWADTSRFEAAVAKVQEAMARLAPGVTKATAALRSFSFSTIFERARWATIRADYETHGRTRPDGRPRRSGHRHRGTPAWARRHG